MVYQKYLEILMQGRNTWNAWRQQEPGIVPDLSSAELSHINLKQTPLKDTDLSGFNLSGVDLSNAKLLGTILDRANLEEVNFEEANLSSADLNNTFLNHANLQEAKLMATNFSNAYLGGANLSGADLEETNLENANLENAKLIRVNLDTTCLRGANLSFADLTGAKINHADLSDAIFFGTTFGWTSLGDIDLRAIQGLETIIHTGPSTIGTDTISRSEGDIPEIFLRGAGVTDAFITYARSLAQNPIEYYTCFLSYSSKDEPFAKRLYADLQSNNVRCWFAPEDMDVGDKIRPRIDETIRLYDKLLLVLSQDSIASNWVAYEVERALNKEPEGIPNVLYPIRIDDTILTCTTNWAQDIKHVRHIGDFTKWKDHNAYQISFDRLLRALKQSKPRKE